MGRDRETGRQGVLGRGEERENIKMADSNIGATAIKPPGWDRTGLEAFKYFLFNPDTGEILSRTPLSWFKITVFYCIYYSCLAGFWIGCLHIFFLTLPIQHPKWTLDSGLIGSNPGLGLRPVSTDKRIDSSMIVLKIGDTNMKPTNPDGEGDENIDYAVRAKKYIDLYTNVTDLSNCDDGTLNMSKDRRCIFDTSLLGECADFPYGFTVPQVELPSNEGFNPGTQGRFAEPCIFLKLNKIFNWEPKPISCENARCAELEKEKYNKMSEDLKTRIRNAHQKNDADNVWVECFGRYPADREALELEYFPDTQAMPTKYFPYRGGNYHSPIVAIKIKHRESASCSDQPHYQASNCGQLTQIECRAWYDGVIHSTRDKMGLVQFDIHMLPDGDNPPKH